MTLLWSEWYVCVCVRRQRDIDEFRLTFFVDSFWLRFITRISKENTVEQLFQLCFFLFFKKPIEIFVTVSIIQTTNQLPQTVFRQTKFIPLQFLSFIMLCILFLHFYHNFLQSSVWFVSRCKTTIVARVMNLLISFGGLYTYVVQYNTFRRRNIFDEIVVIY